MNKIDSLSRLNDCLNAVHSLRSEDTGSAVLDSKADALIDELERQMGMLKSILGCFKCNTTEDIIFDEILKETLCSSCIED